MMGSNASRGTVFGADAQQKAETRFDLANLSIQRYGDSVVASYTLLLSTALPDGVQVVAHNESRVCAAVRCWAHARSAGLRRMPEMTQIPQPAGPATGACRLLRLFFDMLTRP
jgi:hypothetical protein